LIAVLLVLTAVAQAPIAGGVMGLTSLGELRLLRDRRPDLYTKAQAILALAETRPSASVGPWIEARFGASDVELL
jgi:hypothetical protein